MRIFRIARAATLSVLLLPAAASAQWRLRTSAGAYLSGTDIGRITSDGQLIGASIKQETALAVGIGANRWFGDRAGLELAASYVAGSVTSSAEQAVVPFGSGDLLTGGSARGWLAPVSARLLYRLTRGASTPLLYAGLGPTVIWSGGDAYRTSDGFRVERGTDLGLSAVLGGRRPLSESVSLTGTLDGWFYPATLRAHNAASSPVYRVHSRFQRDFVLSIGLTVAVPHR